MLLFCKENKISSTPSQKKKYYKKVNGETFYQVFFNNESTERK